MERDIEVLEVESPDSEPGVLLRIIRTMHEPRAVTAWLVYIYAVHAATAAWIPLSPGPTPPMQGLAGLAFLVAGVVGVPAAWCGYRGVERYALLAMLLGWALIGVEDLAHVVRTPTPDLTRTPGLLLVAALVMCGWAGKRWWQTRHVRWAAGQEPDTPLRRAKLAAEAERLMTREAATRPTGGKDGDRDA